MEQIHKIVSIGNAFVGKTSLARRYVMDTFSVNYIPTMGTSWYTKTVHLTPANLNENLTKDFYVDPMDVRLSLWDTGGQELFSYLRPKYYDGAKVAIIVFDITNSNTFEDVDLWHAELNEHCPDIPIILCGNKYDLKNARAFPREEAENYSKIHNFDYIETSALSSYNVDLLFKHACRLSIQKSMNVLEFKTGLIV